MRLGPRGLHGNLGELLLGQVQGLADDGDAILLRVPAPGQAASQDSVVRHVEEADRSVPAFVVKPHLEGADGGEAVPAGHWGPVLTTAGSIKNEPQEKECEEEEGFGSWKTF